MAHRKVPWFMDSKSFESSEPQKPPPISRLCSLRDRNKAASSTGGRNEGLWKRNSFWTHGHNFMVDGTWSKDARSPQAQLLPSGLRVAPPGCVFRMPCANAMSRANCRCSRDSKANTVCSILCCPDGVGGVPKNMPLSSRGRGSLKWANTSLGGNHIMFMSMIISSLFVDFGTKKKDHQNTRMNRTISPPEFPSISF